MILLNKVWIWNKKRLLRKQIKLMFYQLDQFNFLRVHTFKSDIGLNDLHGILLESVSGKKQGPIFGSSEYTIRISILFDIKELIKLYRLEKKVLDLNSFYKEFGKGIYNLPKLENPTYKDILKLHKLYFQKEENKHDIKRKLKQQKYHSFKKENSFQEIYKVEEVNRSKPIHDLIPIFF